MSLTIEQKFQLAKSAEFQKILQTDPVLDELERSRLNMDDERSALFAFFGTMTYKLGTKTIHPVTPAGWCSLWAAGNKMTGSGTIEAADLDMFFYVLSLDRYVPRPGSLDVLRMQSRGFVSDQHVAYDDAMRLASGIIADAFRPLQQLPPSSGDDGSPVFGADWLAAVISVVHRETGAGTNEIMMMPMSKVATLFVAHAKRYDTKHEIFKLTDGEVARKIIERTEELGLEYITKAQPVISKKQ